MSPPSARGSARRLGLWAFWLYNGGLVLWILLNFFPIGWPQLNAVFEHGFHYARSVVFYNTTLIWQWMRLPGDVLFAVGALLMGWDVLLKLGPLYPWLAKRLPKGPPRAPGAARPAGAGSRAMSDLRPAPPGE